jgi:hypothetical protein
VPPRISMQGMASRSDASGRQEQGQDQVALYL